MNFMDTIKQVYDTKWSYINTFGVYFNFPDILLKMADWTDYDNDKLQVHIISVDTPQYTNSPIESFVANKWALHNGRDQVYRFTVTFRDSDQMNLYKKFSKMYHASREQYFDDVKCFVGLYKTADWKQDTDYNYIFHSESVMIENVSQVQFNNNTENQIAEFSVGFKAPIVTLH